MSTYARLRPFYHRSPEERIRMLCAELAAPLERARAAINALTSFEPAQTAMLFGGRFDDLALVLHESLPRLIALVDDGPGLCERARASGGLSDAELHMYRHDILTPLGNISGVAKLLARVAPADAPPGYAEYANTLTDAAQELLDIVDALTASQERP